MVLFCDIDREEVGISDRDHKELYMRKKIPVAVLGATGAVGQRMIALLSVHPWFEIVQLTGSDRSRGKKYKEAVQWLLEEPLPASIADHEVSLSTPRSGIALAFSALDSGVAEEVESQYADFGIPVVTNAKPHRMKSGVPLCIPEVNMDHLLLIDKRKKGFIVANPNCAAIGLSLAVKPLIDCFGVKKIHVTTYQSVSGAGYPGVPSCKILDNIIPFIEDEEEKLESEPKKIFAKRVDRGLVESDIEISASCVRVPVTEGHLESVSVSLVRKPQSLEEVATCFSKGLSSLNTLSLPSAPKKPIHYFSEREYPQPRLHRNLDKGMAVSIGGVRTCSLFDLKFFLLSHNTIRGAAGNTLLIGELLVQKGLIFW